MTRHSSTREPHRQWAFGVQGQRPVVAIVGRPNVGKSTLFNRLADSRIAIVEDTPGVTRDRLYADAQAYGRDYILVDTGGFDPESDDPLKQSIVTKVQLSLEEADLVLCVFDGSKEPIPQDREAVRLLRRTDRPVIYLANKIDNPRIGLQTSAYYELGIPELHLVSALHGHGIGDLEDIIYQFLPSQEVPLSIEDQQAIKVAIVGRPNVGKSSLVNRLLGADRQIVDDRPGTTMDSVDSWLKWEEQSLILIDTAGIRRKKAVKTGLESLGVLQAIHAVERCHVVLLMLDSVAGPAEQDTKIASLALDRGRALLLALNKQDLLDAKAGKKAEIETREVLSFLPWAPICKISARTGQGVKGLMQRVVLSNQNHQKRITTGEVNRFFEEVLQHHPPPTSGGRSIRFYYVTQASVRPPTFVVMSNYPDRIHFSYRRYVVNQLRRRFGFEGSPVRVFYRKR